MKRMFKTINLALIISVTANTCGMLAVSSVSNTDDGITKWAKVQKFVADNKKKLIAGTAATGLAGAGVAAYFASKSFGKTTPVVAPEIIAPAVIVPAQVKAPAIAITNPIVNSKNVTIGATVAAALSLTAITLAVIAWKKSWYSAGWNKTKNGFKSATTTTSNFISTMINKLANAFKSTKIVINHKETLKQEIDSTSEFFVLEKDNIVKRAVKQGETVELVYDISFANEKFKAKSVEKDAEFVVFDIKDKKKKTMKFDKDDSAFVLEEATIPSQN